ncbi:MAG: DUF3795 domain-containing protein [Anaerolineae bacterium]
MTATADPEPASPEVPKGFAPASDLLAACGLYCGACYHHRASFPEGAHLLSESMRAGRPLEGYCCSGCWSGSLYVHPGCRDCSLRACVVERGYAHCGMCDAFPYLELLNLASGRYHAHLPSPLAR